MNSAKNSVMTYYTNLFSPETYTAFRKSDMKVTGFREGQESAAEGVRPGDRFICYVTRLSRWIGVLEVVDNYYTDDTPTFTSKPDPFTIRFKVKPIVWLDFEMGIPTNESILWDHLSFTKKHSKGHLGWTGMIRGSLRRLSDKDGKHLNDTLLKQNSAEGISLPLSEQEQKKLKITTVKTQDSKEVIVSIPENEDSVETPEKNNLIRESIQIQALLAEIGDKMGMRIWIPRSDRQRVLEIWNDHNNSLLETLPLNYDTATLTTIENIDILWIKGRSIKQAFEVEHTTSIYSGILRMADLMALQPNININIHIVAPLERKEKVFQEISRPVFAFLERGPLSNVCSFMSYDSVKKLSKEKLKYMTDEILQEYTEFAEELEY